MEGEEKKELVERRKGNEESANSLEGKRYSDQENEHKQCENIFC